MLKAKVSKKTLDFAFAAGTSRGILHQKPTWYIEVSHDQLPGITGIGECSPIWGLSPEVEFDHQNEQACEHAYEKLVFETANQIQSFERLLKGDLLQHPSVYFGLETAMMDLFKGGRRIFFENDFTAGKYGIPINGLVWMNTIDEMYQQAVDKFNKGFTCIKIKVGALNTDEEIKLLKQLRAEFGKEVILRIDANGAFDRTTAQDFLMALREIKLHSIEQPIKAGQLNEMKQLIQENTVPIALDEELIGITSTSDKNKLLEDLKPHYIVLKPSLHGGLMGCRQWINAIEQNKGHWWMTSALESNIGLNAIAQFTTQTQNYLHQGLGTGQIYTNNIVSPLEVRGQELFYNPNKKWE